MVSAPPRTLEHKVMLGGIELKAGDGHGSVQGYASCWDGVDGYGDTVLPGAYTDTIASFIKTGALLHEHSTHAAIGTISAAFEDRRGLVIGADFHSDADSQRVRRQIAERLDRNKSVGLSIGFWAEEVGYRDARPGETLPDGVARVRQLKKVRLAEVSVVLMPADEQAHIFAAKSRGGATMTAAPARLDDVGARLRRLGVDTTTAPASGGGLGRRVATSPQVKQVANRKVEVARIVSDLDLRALLVPPAALSEPYGVAHPGLALPGVTSFLPVVQTESGAVDIPKVGRASGALPVAPATAISGATGLKPELVTSYGPSTRVVLTTIAGYVETTTRALADAALMAQLIDGDVRQAVSDTLDSQVLSGDGVAPNMRGIVNWAGIGSVTATAGSELAALLQAVALATTGGRRVPTVAFISLGSWAKLIGTPSTIDMLGPEMTLPGNVPLVPTSGLADGIALIGCGPTAPIFSRGNVSVELGFHDANFTRNVITVRGELDAVVGVVTPACWVKISGLGTAP
jgi:HK97 family phage prohead protease